MLSLIQSNKVLKFAFVLCLCFCLLFVGSFRANAAATAVGVVAAVALLCLAAWGVSTYATDMTEEGVSDYMQGEVDEWANAAGVSLASVEAGIGQTALGQVVLNPFAAKAMRLFAGWYVQQNGIEAGGDAVEVVSGGVTFGGFPVYFPSEVVGRNGSSTYTFGQSSAEPLMFCFLAYQNQGTTPYLYAVSYGANTLRYFNNGSQVRTATLRQASGSRVYYSILNITFSSSTVWSVPVSSFQIEDVIEKNDVTISSADGSLEMIPSDVIGIPSEEDLENKDVILDFNNLSGLDWIQSIDKILGDVVANDVDVTSQLVEEGAITTTDDVVQQPIVGNTDGIDWPDITQPIGVSGFDDVFPFCLPFDVAHFFEALAADPVAPNFEIPFNVPNLIDYTFEIDLSEFDEAAQIFRTMELFAFIVGLAFVTRNFFIRG